MLSAVAVGTRAETPAAKATGAVKYSLNTSTIRGQKVGLVREVEIAAEAGYDAIEPWMGTINDFVKGGGSLKDLGNSTISTFLPSSSISIMISLALGRPEKGEHPLGGAAND